MKPNTEVSIIVPVYNREQTLRKCLDSVLAQTYDSWECILVDDGSVDSSFVVCEEYARKEGRFRIFRQENGGVSSARNKGLDHATGNYITFVDSDDYIDPDYLKKLLEGVDGHDMSLGRICCVSSKNEYTLKEYHSKTILLEGGYEDDIVEIDRLHLLNGPTCILYKQDIIRKNQIRFLPGISYGEDTLFNFTYLRYIRSMRVIADYLYFYCETPGSLSDDYTKKYSLELFLHIWEAKSCLFKVKKMGGGKLHLRLCFLYCSSYWSGLAHIESKHKELTFFGRYTYLKNKIAGMDTKIVDEDCGYSVWRRFLMKHPLLTFLFFEMKYRIKK